MTLILTEGFESYPASAYLDLGTNRKWNAGSSGELQNGIFKTGAVSFRSVTLAKTVAGGQEHARFVIGTAWRAGYNIFGRLMSVWGDANTVCHVSLYRNVGGSVSVYRGDGTTLIAGPSAPVLNTSFFHYLELDVTVDDVAGSVNVYLDSNPTPILTFAGDTRNGGAAALCDTFRINGPSFQWCDDIYLLTGAGAAPFNAPLGEVRVYPLAPNGNGATNQGVGSDGNSVDNYLLVDETALGINTADYVGIFTDGNKDLYEYDSLIPVAGSIANVEEYSYAIKTDSGPKSIRHRLRTAGLEFTGVDQALAPVNYVSARDQFFLNPNTGLQWTIAEVNALQAGFEARP